MMLETDLEIIKNDQRGGGAGEGIRNAEEDSLAQWSRSLICKLTLLQMLVQM